MPNAADLAEQGFERALLLRSVRRFEDALRELDGCLAIDPEHGRSLIYRAEVLRQLGRFEEAATQAQKAIAAAPDQGLSHEVLGRVYLDQDLPGTAERALRKALEIEVTAVRLGLMGLALVNQKRARESLGWTERGLQLDSQQKTCLLARGWAYLDLNRPAQAYEVFQSMLASEPEGQGLYGLSQACVALGKPEQARELAATFLRLYPEDPQALDLYRESLKAGYPIYRLAIRCYSHRVNLWLAFLCACYWMVGILPMDGLAIPWTFWEGLLVLALWPVFVIEIVDCVCQLKLARQLQLRKFLPPGSQAKSFFNLLFLASWPWLTLWAPLAPRTWCLQLLLTSTALEQSLGQSRWRPPLFSLWMLALGAGLRALRLPGWTCLAVYAIQLAGSKVGRDGAIYLKDRWAASKGPWWGR